MFHLPVQPMAAVAASFKFRIEKRGVTLWDFLVKKHVHFVIQKWEH